MKRSSIGQFAFALLGVAAAAGASAEVVNTTDGNFTVIESVAPLGASLTYVNGGDGLIGTGPSWPTMADTPANRAFAMQNADHTWLQYTDLNPNGATAIRMSSGSTISSVIAVSGYDHNTESPYEGMEFIIWGSNDGSTWTQGKIAAVYRDGFDPSATGLGPYDNYSTQWDFASSYTMFAITGGNHIFAGQDSEGEIDALYAAAVPEPETYAMMLAGLGAVGFMARRRKQS